MAQTLIRSILAAMTLLAATSGSIAADSSETAAKIQGAIAGLDSEEWGEREAASSALARFGAPALPAVIKAANEGSPEATWRAVEVLNEFALSTDPAVVDTAEQALTKLASSDRPTAATRAKETLDQLSQSRHERAVAMITKLGGRFDYTRLTLDANWKGGFEGLTFVKRVLDLRQINIEPSSGLSDADIARLELLVKSGDADRQIKITRFGKAFLGIGGGVADGTNGVIVVSVVPGGPGAGAGLKTNDLITQLDDVKISNFDQLIDHIRSKAVGDKIKVTYFRDGERLTGEAVLQARPGTKELQKVQQVLPQE